MYNILVVDDEKLIADGLAQIMKNRISYEIDVQIAYSAQEAIEICENFPVDLLVSDISMPDMNGFDMAVSIAKKYTKCQVIFLTAYERFDYAYDAFKQNNTTFLLKTESYDKIMGTIENTLSKIDREKSIDIYIEDSKKKLDEHMVMLRKDFIIQLLSGRFVSTKESITKCFEQFKIPFDYNKEIHLIIGKWDDENNRDYYDVLAESQTIETLTKNQFGDMKFIYVALDERFHAWIINKDLIEKIPDMLNDLQIKVRKVFQKTMSFLYDTTPINWEKVSDRVSTLKIDLCYFNVNEALLSDKSKQLVAAIELDKSNPPSEIKLRKLEHYLEMGNKGEYLSLLNELLESLRQCKKNNITALGLYFSLTNILISYITKQQLLPELAFNEDVHVFDLSTLHLENSWSDVAEYLVKFSNTIFDLQSHIAEDNVNTTINNIKQYIDDNLLNGNLSINNIADSVFLSPCYISRFFKEETGILLTDYINQLKIAKAKEMLENPKYRICDISELLGYSTQSSFGRFFKSVTGMSAKHYREKFLHV